MEAVPTWQGKSGSGGAVLENFEERPRRGNQGWSTKGRAGRKPLPPDKKRKNRSLKASDEEWEKIQEFARQLKEESKMKNVYGEKIVNGDIRTLLIKEGTQIAEKVLRVIDRPYFPRVVVNEGIFRYEWSPYGDVDFPDYADKYIKAAMKRWFGCEYRQHM